MEAEQFWAQLAALCRASVGQSWTTALTEATALFAEAVGVPRAQLLLTAQGEAPAEAVAVESPLPADLVELLIPMLTQHPWSTGTELLPWQLPGLTEPVWVLPLPPQETEVLAFLLFFGAPQDFPLPTLEQGAALLTPLVHNAQLQRQWEQASSPLTAELRHAPLLNDIIATINQTLDLDEILQVGLNTAMQVGPMERGALYLWDDQEGCLRLHVHQGLTDEMVQRLGCYRPGEGAIGRAYAEQRETLEWNLVTDRPDLTLAALRSATVQLNLPLLTAGEVSGVLSLTRTAEHPLTPVMQQNLRAIANQLALAIRRSQLTAQLQHQMQALHVLYEISAAFLSQTGTRETIFILLRTLLTVLKDAVGAAFYQQPQPGYWLRSRVYLRRGAEALAGLWQEGPAWPGEAPLLDTCYQTGTLQRVQEHPPFDAPWWDQMAALGGQQLLYLPLGLSPGDTFGVVAIWLTTSHPLAPQETMLTQSLLQQGAVTLSRLRLYETSYEAETRLQAILDSSQDGIILVSNDFKIRYVNRPAVELLALPGEPATWEGRPFTEIILALRWQARPLARHLCCLCKARPSPQPHQPGQFETAHQRILTLRDWPVYSERQRPLGRLFVLHDITAQKTLERMRDDLLRMIVHDMRNPLSVILSALQALQDTAHESDAPRILEIALENTERLLTLVTAILSIGKLEQGEMELHQHPCRLPVLVEQLAQNLQLATKHPRLRLNLPADLPLVWADVTLVERIFQNLLDNALKFIPSEQGLIEITATADDAWVTVEVYNNGDALPPTAEQDLFEKFKTRAYRGQGYGLGLVFCRLAVEAHGGRIWAANHPAGGVSFFFTLPVLHPEDTAAPRPPSSAK